jgi:hypothetical protein
MDSGTKALEEMSRAQSDHRRKYGEPDPGLQRRIDALMKRKGLAKKKKDPEDAYSKPLKGAPKGHNIAKKKKTKKSKLKIT